MKKLCLHRKLKRVRANRRSQYGIENAAKAITVDTAGCYIFVVCASCGKIHDVELDDDFMVEESMFKDDLK